MLPTPKDGFPCEAAMVDTTSSGAEVPNPNTIAPTTTELILSDFAKETAPSTKDHRLLEEQKAE